MKKILRFMMAQIKLMKLSQLSELSKEFFGPSLLSVELTYGVEQMERSHMDSFQLTIGGEHLEEVRTAAAAARQEIEGVLGGTQEVNLCFAVFPFSQKRKHSRFPF